MPHNIPTTKESYDVEKHLASLMPEHETLKDLVERHMLELEKYGDIDSMCAVANHMIEFIEPHHLPYLLEIYREA